MGLGETLFIHLGQCGVQTGMACWELFCMEHGLYPDGTLATEFGHVRNPSETNPIFMETCAGKYVPRAIMYDFDPDVINQIRNGCYRSLFCRDNLFSGKEDAANNFARGYYSMGSEFIECMMDKTRHLAEASNGVAGFIVSRSTGGGTGAGFGSLFLENLTEMFGKTTKITLECNPSPKLSTAAVEPYNTVLCAHGSSEYVDCCFTYENECLYDICNKFLDLRCPTYHHLNQIMAQVMSAVTASFRFSGNLNTNISEMQTNIVPYARIHYPLLSYAPLIPYEGVSHDRLSVNSLVQNVFTPRNQMVKCNTRKGKFMACTLLFRGDVTPNDINSVLARLKGSKSMRTRMQFVDWAPTGFKLGMCSQPPISMPGSAISCGCRALVGIMNTTAIADTWQRVLKKFDLLFYRRAFVHWYVGEGLDEAEFQEARENLETLMIDFHEIGMDSEAESHPEYTSHKHVEI